MSRPTSTVGYIRYVIRWFSLGVAIGLVLLFLALLYFAH